MRLTQKENNFGLGKRQTKTWVQFSFPKIKAAYSPHSKTIWKPTLSKKQRGRSKSLKYDI